MLRDLASKLREPRRLVALSLLLLAPRPLLRLAPAPLLRRKLRQQRPRGLRMRAVEMQLQETLQRGPVPACRREAFVRQIFEPVPRLAYQEPALMLLDEGAERARIGGMLDQRPIALRRVRSERVRAHALPARRPALWHGLQAAAQARAAASRGYPPPCGGTQARRASPFQPLRSAAWIKE